MKRYRCGKCGTIVMIEGNTEGLMCMEDFPLRTSGFCGGEYIEEPWVDYEEWKTLVNFLKW